MQSQYVYTDQQRRRQLRDDEQRVCHFESVDKQRHIDIFSDFGISAADFDAVVGRGLE